MKMQDFSLNTLRRDMRFIDETISVSNAAKKRAINEAYPSKIPKKVKNLRYFLRKKRDIVFKASPTTAFGRAA